MDPRGKPAVGSEDDRAKEPGGAEPAGGERLGGCGESLGQRRGGVVAAPVARGPQAGRADWLEKFILLENRFAWLARFASLLTGLTGFYILYDYDLWDRFAEPSFWWMYGMILVWMLFSFILFIGEPLFQHAREPRTQAVDHRADTEAGRDREPECRNGDAHDFRAPYRLTRRESREQPGRPFR